MKGYLNNPKATAEMIVDGWVHTGDQGYYDENENLFVIGRYKELIKYRMAHVSYQKLLFNGQQTVFISDFERM